MGGILMDEAEVTVRIDEKGRIILPKSIRKASQLKKGAYVTIKAKDKKIIIQPVESVTEKYLGIFKVASWPEDLDQFIIELTKKSRTFYMV
jgi:AbrB family looped-hinge helix DNA binding protein